MAKPKTKQQLDNVDGAIDMAIRKEMNVANTNDDDSGTRGRAKRTLMM